MIVLITTLTITNSLPPLYAGLVVCYVAQSRLWMHLVTISTSFAH